MLILSPRGQAETPACKPLPKYSAGRKLIGYFREPSTPSMCARLSMPWVGRGIGGVETIARSGALQ
jgi:hypothetical protein